MDRPIPAAFRCLTTFWMLVLVACFVIQQVVIVHMGKPYDAYLGLSGYGMKSWHLWELFTCQLLHSGPVHLLVNLVGLWFLGRPVEALLGSRRFLRFCLGASLSGGLLQGGVALAGFVLPESLEVVAGPLREQFGGPVSGASMGLCAVLVAFCRRKLKGDGTRLLGVPVPAAHVLWLAFGAAVLLVIIPTDLYLAHLGHLGSMLAGLAIIRRA